MSKWALSLIGAIGLAGCATVPEVKTVNVPVRVSCVTAVPAKPTRLTPCPKDITNSQCIKRAAVDIERLQSAVDQLTTDLEACR
jgi:outer membrane murein-binding lipoprotein Lpp